MHITRVLLVFATTATASNVARQATPTFSFRNCGDLTSLGANAPTYPPEIRSYFSSVRAQTTFTDQCDVYSFSRGLLVTPPAPLATVYSAYISSFSSFESSVSAARASFTAECPIHTNADSIEAVCARGEKRPIGTVPTPTPTGSPAAAVNGTTSSSVGSSTPAPTSASNTSPTSSVVPAGAASNVVAAGFAAVAFIGAVAAL